MDGWMYYGSLLMIGIFAFSMSRTHHNMLAFIALLVGAYLIYSHETGYTATDFRHEMVDKIDKETSDYDYSKNKEREEAKRIAEQNRGKI
jgi:hypothetical protein